ncbi:MAG: tetratricopeptide repeat protein [Candidatus Omnitrophica bacterium]|nr:tetratricopeptide repeat protein [Candidatus Omnitrophota bacterium]
MKIILQKFLLLFTVVFVAGCSVNQGGAYSRKLIREGDRYFSEGEIDKAIELWQQALDYQQKPELYEKIVMAYIMRNQLSDAEEYISKGLTYFPNNVNLFFNLALINFYNDDFDRAKKNVDRVLEINGYYRDAHFLKGLMYEKEGDIPAAKREFVNELNVNPGSRRAWKKLRELKDE